MNYLLTSAGIKNDSIRNALVESLGKPISESSALCIPTAMYGMPAGADHASRFLRGVASTPLCEVGWKSLGVLELTALPSLKEEYWLPLVQEVDALLVGGGDVLYLCYWMRQSGLADLLPERARETVYVGGERREYGGDPQLRRGLRRLVLSRTSGKSSAQRLRESTRTG